MFQPTKAPPPPPPLNESDLDFITHQVLQREYLNLKIQYFALIAENWELRKRNDEIFDGGKSSEKNNEKICQNVTITRESINYEDFWKRNVNFILISLIFVCFSLIFVIFMILKKRKKEVEGKGENFDKRWNRKMENNLMEQKAMEISEI